MNCPTRTIYFTVQSAHKAKAAATQIFLHLPRSKQCCQLKPLPHCQCFYCKSNGSRKTLFPYYLSIQPYSLKRCSKLGSLLFIFLSWKKETCQSPIDEDLLDCPNSGTLNVVPRDIVLAAWPTNRPTNNCQLKYP